MTIAEFLEARIAEDERRAKYYGPYAMGTTRVLAECAAKRAIVAEWEDPATSQTFGSEVDDGYLIATDRAVRAVTAVYAGHADYRQEWAA